ncbi:MAG: GNAT family N-acetyltransferase [Alphaproteobacteria bacterium]|nr:GNAT family N-acetyltransferase [Alphaproteobacteria bacterium]
MNIELHTNNLIIKKPSEKHLNSLIKELNNWNISKWLIEVPYPYTVDDAKYWVKKTKQDEYSFNIYLKNKLIGGLSLANQRENSKWVLGYWIGEEYWGNGYAIEACENLISYFFSNTNNSIIYASHMKDNIKSKKIIINLGFKLVSSGKKFSISRNEMVEDLNYELRKF